MAAPTYAASRQVMMEGHLFDSLTLPKVLDYILTHNADFLMSSIHIGQTKTDASRVSFTLFAKNDQHLNKLLDELTIYGLQATDDATSELIAVTKEGELPPGAHIVGYLPVEVRTPHQTFESGGHPANALVLVADAGELKVLAQHQLKVGQNVVVGEAGLSWVY